MEKVQVLKIDTEPAQTSLKELRKTLKEYKDQMANMDEGSDAFKQLAVEAGEVKHQIDEINESVKGASSDLGDMIGNATSATAGLVGAFQAVEGALQVMGVESEFVGESIARMQGLMAMTQGLAAIDDGIKAFGKLKTAISLATAGMSKLKVAIASTGIGALVVAVGALAANWETVSKWIGFNNDKLEAQKRLTNEIVGSFSTVDGIISGNVTNEEKLTNQLESLTNTYNILGKTINAINTRTLSSKEFKNWSKTLKEQGIEVNNTNELLDILQDKYKQTGNAIEITKNKLSEYDIQTLSGQEKLIKRYEEVTEQLNQYKILSAEGYQLTISQQEEYNNLLYTEVLLKERINSTNWGLRYFQNKYEEELAKKEEERIERLSKEEKARLENQHLAETITNEAVQYQIGLLEMEVEQKALLMDEDYYNTADYVTKMTQIYDLQASLYERDSIAYMSVMNKKLTMMKDYDLILTEMKNPLEELNSIDFKANFFEDASNAMHYFVANLKPVTTETKKTYNEIYSTFAGVASGITSVMSMTTSVLSTLANEQDANTKEGFEKQKQFNIAAATMNGLMGILNAWVSAMSPNNAWMTIYGQIAMGAAQTAATAALMGIQIDSIKKQTLGGSSGSSPSAAGIGAVTSAPVRRDVNGASITQALNQQHSTRVYVLESDITNTQKKVDVQESENVF